MAAGLRSGRPAPLSWRLLAWTFSLLLAAALGVVGWRWWVQPAAIVQPGFRADSVYLWQRQWTPEVRAAVLQQGPFHELRVLALEVGVDGQMVEPTVDLQALARSRLRVVPVVRMDGRRPPLPAAELRTRVQALRERWQASGVTTRSVELDHDSARAGLPAYRQWLAELRADWPQAPDLAITGLPDWLHSPELPALIHAVEGFTLQVHAVDRPEAGLFDAARARAWVARLDQLSPRAYAVALPTYAAHIRGQLYWADPQAVAELLAFWRQQPPAGLRVVRFFRLPVEGDLLTWSAATLQAVATGQPHAAEPTLTLQPGPAGALDLVAQVQGPLDAWLPQAVRFGAACQGDGVAGYRFETHADHTRLVAMARDRLVPGRRRTLGWIRCAQPVEMHVDVH